MLPTNPVQYRAALTPACTAVGPGMLVLPAQHVPGHGSSPSLDVLGMRLDGPLSKEVLCKMSLPSPSHSMILWSSEVRPKSVLSWEHRRGLGFAERQFQKRFSQISPQPNPLPQRRLVEASQRWVVPMQRHYLNVLNNKCQTDTAEILSPNLCGGCPRCPPHLCLQCLGLLVCWPSQLLLLRGRAPVPNILVGTKEGAPCGLTSDSAGTWCSRRGIQAISLSHIVVSYILKVSSTAFLPARSSSLGLLAHWEALLGAGAGWRERAQCIAVWVYFQGAFRLADGLDHLPVLFSLRTYEVLLKQGEKSIKIKTQEVEIYFDLNTGKNSVCAIASWEALRM